MKIAAVHVFIRYNLTRAEKKRGEYHGRLERTILHPKGKDIKAIKLDIARIIDAAGDTALYYYVVIAVRQPNGKFGYRTVVPKQVIAE